MTGLAQGTRDEAEAWIGREREPRSCSLSISTVHGQLACCMVEDANPLYWEPERALAALGYEAVPPATLMTWGLPLPWSPVATAPAPPLWAQVPLPGDTIINVATTTSFPVPLAASAQLTMSEQVVAISERRSTRVGDGHFLTTRAEYHDTSGNLRATHDNTMLRYTLNSPTRRPEPPPPGAETLPTDGRAFELDLTRLHSALNVGATWDFFPSHYDDDYARAQGVPASYVNTLFLHALVDRAATDLVRERTGGRLCTPVLREMAMRRPVVIGTHVTVHATDDEPAGTETRRCPITVVDADGLACVDATVDVRILEEERRP